MFCPNCKFEYQSHVTECPDCQEKLVEKLPIVHEEYSNVHFVPMPDLPGKVYAEMVRGALESKGIPCYLHGDVMMDTFGVAGTSPVAGGARIFVPEDRLEECMALQNELVDHI